MAPESDGLDLRYLLLLGYYFYYYYCDPKKKEREKKRGISCADDGSCFFFLLIPPFLVDWKITSISQTHISKTTPISPRSDFEINCRSMKWWWGLSFDSSGCCCCSFQSSSLALKRKEEMKMARSIIIGLEPMERRDPLNKGGGNHHLISFPTQRRRNRVSTRASKVVTLPSNDGRLGQHTNIPAVNTAKKSYDITCGALFLSRSLTRSQRRAYYRAPKLITRGPRCELGIRALQLRRTQGERDGEKRASSVAPPSV